jgi:hypothetical protein
VTITFAYSGATNFDSNTQIITIDGTPYTVNDLGWRTFTWQAWTTHTISARQTLTGWETQPNQYNFTSWTNGNGLVTASGTFTTPTSSMTVTINYVIITYDARFQINGINNFDVNAPILTIDGTGYSAAQLNWQYFRWVIGSTHSVQAATPVTNYDTPAKTFSFSDWTNGNGLTGVSGTFTMPNGTVTATANYVQSSVHVNFAQSGLSNMNSGVTIITIDGVNYDYFSIAQTNFQWVIGSTHTVSVPSQVTGWDNRVHVFSSWTNGNGLTGTSGTFTTPSTDVTTTVNFTP